MWFASFTHVSYSALASLWDPGAGIEELGLMLDSTWGQGLNIGHPQLIIFKLCSPKMTILWGWSTFSDTAPWYFDLLSLALRDAMDRFWHRGSKGTKHNAPTQKLGGIPGWSWPDSERLHRFHLNVIMRGLPDVVFDITWLIYARV